MSLQSFVNIGDDVLLSILERLDFCDATNFRVVLTLDRGYNLPLTKRERTFLKCLVSYRDCSKNKHIECLARYHRVNSENMWKIHKTGSNIDAESQIYLYSQKFLTKIEKTIVVRHLIRENDFESLSAIQNCDPIAISEISETTRFETLTQIARMFFSTKSIRDLFLDYLLSLGMLIPVTKICQQFRVPRTSIVPLLLKNYIFVRAKKYIKPEELVWLVIGSIVTPQLMKITREDLSFLEECRDKCISMGLNVETLTKSINILRIRYSLPLFGSGANYLEYQETAFFHENMKYVFTLGTNFDMNSFFYAIVGGSLEIINYYCLKTGFSDSVTEAINLMINHESENEQLYEFKENVVSIVKYFSNQISPNIYNIISNYKPEIIIPLLKLIKPISLPSHAISDLVKYEMFDEFISRGSIKLNFNNMADLIEYPNIFDKYFDEKDSEFICIKLAKTIHTKEGYYNFKKYQHRIPPQYMSTLLECEKTPTYVYSELGMEITIEDTFVKNDFQVVRYDDSIQK